MGANGVSMIPVLYRYIGGFLVFFLLLGGAYLKGKANGKEMVQAKFDRYKEVAQLAYDRQVAKTAEIQAQWDKSQERESEIKAKLQVVTLESADLSRSLRSYRARLRALSEAPRPAGVPDPTAGESADLEQAEADHYAACSRDAERLSQYQAFYKALQDTQ